MDIKQKIDIAKQILSAGGNIIKTRDDRELVLIDKDGKVQNEDVCSWLPNKDDNDNNGNVDKTVT